MTKREQILAAIATALAPTAGVSGRVFRSRGDALASAEAPCVVVLPESEEVSELNISIVEAHLAVLVEVYARAVSGADSSADPVCESVHALLMAGPTLGGLAIDTSEAGTTFDFDQADENMVIVSMRFAVWYRHNRTTLS